MKKYLVMSAIALSMNLTASSNEIAPVCQFAAFKPLIDDFLTTHRHGLYLGLEASNHKSRVYDYVSQLKTGSNMPGIELGYLYEAPLGICWHAGLKVNAKKESGLGLRDASHVYADFRYRFAFSEITAAPIIGLQVDVASLEKKAHFLVQQSFLYLGAEFTFPLTMDISSALEIKGKTFYSHHFMFQEGNQLYASKLKTFYGAEVDFPVRINLGVQRNHQLEIKPFYAYESLGTGIHKIGLQANIIHWF